MLVNLLALPVLAQQTTQNSHAADPEDLGGHAGVGGTLPLAQAHVASLTASQSILAHAGTGVHLAWLLDDQTILHQLADVLACGETNQSHGWIYEWR